MVRAKRSSIAALCVAALFLTVALAMDFEVRGGHPTGSRIPGPYSATVEISLEYPNSDPAESFEVRLLNIGQASYNTVSGTTDLNGECTLYVESNNWGPCRLWAYDAAEVYWWNTSLFVEPDGNHPIVGVLKPFLPWTNEVKGKVTDVSTGLPLSGQPVGFNGEDENWAPISLTEFTAADGSYTMYLPEASRPYKVTVAVAGYDTYTNELHIVQGKDAYDLDIELRPEYSGTVPLHVRALRKGSSDILPLYYASASGYAADRENTRQSSWSYSGDPVTGYFDLMVGPGEYGLGFETEKDIEWNVSMRFQRFAIVNGTEMFVDAEVPYPEEWRRVDVHVKDGMGPIASASVGYYMSLYDPREHRSISASAYTDASGNTKLGIPPDMEVVLDVWEWGYDTSYITIPPGPVSEPVDLDVTLEPTAPDPIPEGQVSIKVVDEVSGIIVPKAQVSASLYSDEHGRWISFYGMAGTDGYFNATVKAATYPVVKAYYSIGSGSIKNLSVPEGGTGSAVISLIRNTFPPDPVEISLNLVSAEGGPVAGQAVTMDSLDHPSSTYKPVSDNTGMIRAKVLPGSYLVSMYEGYESSPNARSHWRFEEIDFEVPPEGGSLGEIVMYPTHPLDSVEGFIRDSSTGMAIPNQELGAYSRRYLDMTPTRQVPYIMPYFESLWGEEENYVHLFSQYSIGSDDVGYYRAWGRDTVDLYCDREGYYPYREKLDMTSRAGKQMDIMLEPVPELSTWVNGTLVDIDDNPLEGFVVMVDPEKEHFIVDEGHTDPSGVFSFMCYPGSLRAVFGTPSMWDKLDLEVPPEGIEGLKLVLAPTYHINGTVVDWKDDPLEGIDLVLDMEVPSLLYPPAYNGSSLHLTTGADGSFSLRVVAGSYRLSFAGNELYAPGTLEIEVISGSIDVKFVLGNRTFGSISGAVMAQGGPFSSGIPNASVSLKNAILDIHLDTVSGPEGVYAFEDVPYGAGYLLIARPPEGMEFMNGVRSGYGNASIEDIELDVSILSMDITLIYEEIAAPEFVSIVDRYPAGSDVGINQRIRVSFSHSMNRTTVESGFVITPELNVTGFTWSGDGRTVTLVHSDLIPNTTYTIEISSMVLSYAGHVLDPSEVRTWDFTTGEGAAEWHLTYVMVEVIKDRTVIVNVEGGQGQSVYIVIDGVGSFNLDETEPGKYYGSIAPFNFDWDMRYDYHFSDRDGGPDMWPLYKGYILTPLQDRPMPPISHDEETVGPGFLGCLGLCGAIILIIIILVALVLIISKVKSRIDDKEE
ncbi:MAG: Ig-like domain-containing protein [Candidatus Thermoplasmatota archaeon]|nr:Ig-like domain-containing protein [Candidatus Thermoplasmatota archaeon]